MTKQQDFPIGERVLAGSMTSVQAVEACLERIERLDGALRSFVQLRADAALSEAAALDAAPKRGPLHGVPFAAKDVFDTADLATEYHSPYYRGHRPSRDAAAIALLRQAGGVLLGKLSTVEFAGVGAIPDTRNPHDRGRTPGGSSAGSGAAVGAGLVPLATATQTGGSTIRPAAFCGAAGYKPTWGRISCEGVKPFAPSLDTVGFIAGDCALLQRAARACGIGGPAAAASDRALRIGYYRTPYFDEARPETRAALASAIESLEAAGHVVEEVDGPAGQERLNAWQDDVMFGEGQYALRAEFQAHPELAHPGVRALAENHKQISPARLREAGDRIAALRPLFDQAMQGFDAWLCPAVPGEAPPFEEGNGLATFNRLFTALHLPCVTVAGLQSERGLPVGVQLIAPRDADLQLLGVARKLERLLSSDRGPAPA
jgi:Asp-tRNA(Asn)/Glu-tRNA(Gln) amidotransferase A subunit family amidase